MEEKKYFLFKELLTEDKALEMFKKAVLEDTRFIDTVDDKFLTVEQKYNSYYFFDCDINNHPYFFKNKQTDESYDGKMDIRYSMSDKDFILNELNKKDGFETDSGEYPEVDLEKRSRVYKEFIEGIKDRALRNITAKHNAKPSKWIHIDISPLEGFHRYSEYVYFEKIYIFRYRNEQRKTDFVSILSACKLEFYEFDFVKTSVYQEFLTKYKRPVGPVPKEYMDYYYIDAFRIYSQMNQRLEFETSKNILKKIRNNIRYENYSLYKEYLETGIFYYRIQNYLKKLNVAEKPLKYHIYMAYLTLKHQKESGYFLYECADLGLLHKNAIQDKLRFLEYSCRLGNLKAKKALYEHYSFPLYFNPVMVKKYS